MKGTSIFSENITATEVTTSNEEYQQSVDSAGRLHEMKRHGLSLQAEENKKVKTTARLDIGTEDETRDMTVQAENAETTQAVSPDSMEADSIADFSMDIDESSGRKLDNDFEWKHVDACKITP